MPATAVFSLNAHASYSCRHSGACCKAGWTIPVEPGLRSVIGTEWLVPRPDGSCPQFDHPTGLCRLHRDSGEEALPESCYQFPRRALTDSRGTFVTLSHFCPTAASMLLDADEPLDIVSSPSAFPADRRYEGLDAVGHWRPLLRPDALFDDDSFSLWEQYVVRSLGASATGVETTLSECARTAELLRDWTDSRGSLLEWTTRVLSGPPSANDEANRRYEPFTGTSAFVRVCATVPAGLEVPALPDSLAESDAAFVADGWVHHSSLVLRYLGAKAFASWTAYQSRGIRTQIAELFATAAVLRVECGRACARRRTRLNRNTLLDAIRASDWLLVHLADRETLMQWLGKAESDAAAFSR